MNENEEHSIPVSWLLEEAVTSCDVPYVTHLTNAISMYHLQKSNPEVYRMLASAMGRTREVQEQRNSPKQIGQLVGKQDNHYMMSDVLNAHILQLLQKKNNKNSNDGRREEDAF